MRSSCEISTHTRTLFQRVGFPFFAINKYTTMSKMARNKGKRGERMVIDWLQPIVDEICLDLNIKQVLLQRNTVQSDRGGSDIVGLPWLAAEVKNCESNGPANLDKWWEQTIKQAHEWADHTITPTPVLFYTSNHRPIRVRMMGAIAAPEDNRIAWVYSMVDVSAEDFERYFRSRTKLEFLRTKALDSFF